MSRLFPFRAEWIDLRFIHLQVAPAALQPFVPFPLDLFEGDAWVSLVAFEQRRFRPTGTGSLGAALFKPLASHPFLNVRTYVRCGNETGIFFLAEWVPLRLAAIFGPRTWGLPYRLGKLDYRHDPEQGVSHCEIRGDGSLRLRVRHEPESECFSAGPGSLDEFLLERYIAYTMRGRRPFVFRVNHPAWRVQTADVQFEQDDLLSRAFPWYGRSSLAGAHASEGFTRVRMGAPVSCRDATCRVSKLDNSSTSIPERVEEQDLLALQE